MTDKKSGEFKTSGGYFKKVTSKILSVSKCMVFSLSISWKTSKKDFLLRVAIEAVNVGIPVFTTYLGKEVINLIVETVQKGNAAEGIQHLVRLLVIMLILQLAGSALYRLNDLCSEIYREKVANFINMQIIEKTSELDISYFDSPKFQDEIMNARRDSQSLQSLTWVSIGTIRSMMQIFIGFPILFKFHWSIPIILLLLRVPSIIVEKKYTRFTYDWTKRHVPEERKMSYIQGILTTRSFAKELRLYNLIEDMICQYIELWNKRFKEKSHIAIQRGKWTVICSILPQIAGVGILLYIASQIIYKKLSIGDYSFYSGISGQYTGGISSLINSITQIYDSELRIANYMKFLEFKPVIKESGVMAPDGCNEIEFKDVSFKYPGSEKYILKDLNFKIKAGEKIALVGLNGAGKSTVVKLILRFYDPTEGQITINGTDITRFELKELRKLFTAKFQDFPLYAFRARDNIAISDFESINDDERISEACIISGVDEIIPKWKNGIDSYLTKQFEEDGEELSGGEGQKLAIARAYFRKSAKVIILDEPNSALDPEAEHAIYKRFSELCEGRTAFFISHRLSSVTMADRILVLEGGKIIEFGPHDQLMQKGGRYAYLFNLQAEKYINRTSA